MNKGKLLLISMKNKHIHHSEKWRKIEEKYIVNTLSKIGGVPESAFVQAPIQPTIIRPEDNSSMTVEEKRELVKARPVRQTEIAPLTLRRIGQDQVIEDGSISEASSKPNPLPTAPISQLSVPNYRDQAVQPK